MLSRATLFCIFLTSGILAAPPAGRTKVTSAKSCCAAAASLPAAALGSVSFTGGAVNVVVNGTTAYACGTNAIGVIDISNPASPRLLSTFAQGDLAGNAISGCYQFGQSLVVPVNTQAGFVYDISDARNIRSQARFTPAFPYNGHVSFTGNTGWFTTDWFEYNTGSNTIFAQHGDFHAVDFTDPAHPSPIGSLPVNSSQPASSNRSPRFGSISNGSDTVYIMSTTAVGGDPNGGQGAIQIIDVGDPPNPKGLAQILIPQATVMMKGAVQDNIVLVTGNTKGWRNPGVNPRNNTLNFQFTGVLTLTALDVSDWRNPVLLSSRCSDVATWTLGGVASVGGGFFAVAAGPPSDDAIAFGTDPSGQLLLVDARDPANLGLISMGPVAKLQGVSVSGDKLFAATGDGLSIFQLPDLSGL
jgi:LVIVD repeat-containing protein